MKTLQFFICSLFMLSFSFAASAQEKSESFKVAGNCGMCKSKIEKAAKSAGATYAQWNVETKQLAVKYSSTSANAAKIQQTIARAGYDTPTVKATTEAYNNLHGCCQYERETTTTTNEAKTDCCTDGKCAKTGEACAKDKACCTTAADHTTTGNPACCKKA